MNARFRRVISSFAFAGLALLAASCGSEQFNGSPGDSGNGDGDTSDGTPTDTVTETEGELTSKFPNDEHSGEEFPHCVFTSPLHYEEDGDSWVIVSRANGVVQALDPDTGAAEWSVELPEPEQGVKYVLGDPARVGNRLVYGYHAIEEDFGEYLTPNDKRLAHLVAVVDLEQRSVDTENFPVVELQADLEANESGRQVSFKPKRALTRPKVVHGAGPNDELGKVYLGQGNTRDVQPWHGWAWEIDLDVWRDEGADAATTGVLNTTPEPDENCGDPGTSGSRERLCGGGLWAPSGHLVVERDDGTYRVVLAPGNGQLNLNRRDYANTLLKVRPGLTLEPGCDAQACSNFDPDAPSEECMESCDNIFIPRLMPGQNVPRPTDGRCEDKDTMFECWEEMDYIGGSTPVHVETEEHELLAYPTKDGHAYLVDWEHFGTMYDRHKMVELCGSNGGSCEMFWAGMSVTKPLETEVDGTSLVMVPTFMPDSTNPAGVVAMEVVETDNGPRLQRAWEYPSFDEDRAVERFRRHPSRMAMGRHGPDDDRVAWVVDVQSERGILSGIDPETGTASFERRLSTSGRRYSVPLTTEDGIYVSSCNSNKGPGRVEGFEVREVEK